MMTSEQSVATLIFPSDYLRQLNSVAGITTQNIIFLKRKFLSKEGWELVRMPMIDCTGISYREDLAPMRIMFGIFLVGLVVFIAAMLVKYWSDLEPRTRVPVGAVTLVGLYGTVMVFGARRHRFTFTMKDGSRLEWKSRSGDYKLMKEIVDKLREFARSNALMPSTDRV